MDNIWGLLGTVAIGYLIYKALNQPKGRVRRLGVLNGGRHPDGQFMTTSSGPPSGLAGAPQIAVLGWPNMGDCKC